MANKEYREFLMCLINAQHTKGSFNHHDVCTIPHSWKVGVSCWFGGWFGSWFKHRAKVKTHQVYLYILRTVLNNDMPSKFNL